MTIVPLQKNARGSPSARQRFLKVGIFQTEWGLPSLYDYGIIPQHTAGSVLEFYEKVCSPPLVFLTEKVYTIPVMEEKTIADRIRERLASAPDGTLFVMSDFADIGAKNVANRVVLRLVAEGKLRTIMRGVYQKPRINAFLKEYEEPSVDAVAHAISRKNGWTTCPSGDAALNLLGLSTQVPATWSYLSNGPYKSYPYGGGSIRFTHTANRMMENLSPESALVVQAFRALGSARMDELPLSRIVERYSAEQLSRMEIETRKVPDWIHGKIALMKEIKNA